jgi:Ion channel/Pentapeptide repeats (8 copies)
MENPEHLEKLKEGVQAWNTWREENPSIVPDLSEAHLENASLFRAHLEHAHLCGANLTNVDVTRLTYLGPPLLEYRHRVMRNRYQGIRGLDSCYGNRIFVRDAADQDYLDTIENQLHSRWGKFCFWIWGLTDYGRSFMSVIVFASILVCIFGGAYSHWHQMISAGDRCPTPFTPYYFSIVTYTTLGFGDVRPNNMAGEILVSMEVILGYVTLGLLLAVLGDRIARRS